MVYLSEEQDDYKDQENVPVLIAPEILRIARQIYRTYYEINNQRTKQPIGIVVDRYTFRGHLIFSNKPVLLPWEYFVPLSQIESQF
ncbi:MAG: hypothetical protein F6K10_06865 [Moorea sp. SIO2B7]|nr:hypothetical protein [Moorena sp. SIO2B7]